MNPAASKAAAAAVPIALVLLAALSGCIQPTADQGVQAVACNHVRSATPQSQAPDWRPGDRWTYSRLTTVPGAGGSGNLTTNATVTRTIEASCLSNGRHVQGILRDAVHGPGPDGSLGTTVTRTPFPDGAVELLADRGRPAWDGCPGPHGCLAEAGTMDAYWGRTAVLRTPLDVGMSWTAAADTTWRVLGTQQVEAGESTFEAIHVQGVATVDERPSLHCDAWYAPEAEAVVLLELHDANGTLLRRDVLLDASLA